MARKGRPEITEEKLQGFKYFKILGPLLESLHEVGTPRDKAQNRQLRFDQYGALLLLHFFNPILTSLRGIQQASHLGKVQKTLGCRGTSLGSLNEAANRELFAQDESAYLEGRGLTPEQRQAVLDRDYLEMLKLGGNIYYAFKIAMFDRKSMQYVGGQMSGMTEEEFKEMMIGGGRPIDGNRRTGES